MSGLMSYQRALNTECLITHLRYKGAHHYVCVYELTDGCRLNDTFTHVTGIRTLTTMYVSITCQMAVD